MIVHHYITPPTGLFSTLLHLQDARIQPYLDFESGGVSLIHRCGNETLDDLRPLLVLSIVL